MQLLQQSFGKGERKLNLQPKKLLKPQYHQLIN